jgi:hypothetical protein
MISLFGEIVKVSEYYEVRDQEFDARQFPLEHIKISFLNNARFCWLPIAVRITILQLTINIQKQWKSHTKGADQFPNSIHHSECTSIDRFRVLSVTSDLMIDVDYLLTSQTDSLVSPTLQKSM